MVPTAQGFTRYWAGTPVWRPIRTRQCRCSPSRPPTPLVDAEASAGVAAMTVARAGSVALAALPMRERLAHVVRLRDAVLQRREEIVDRIQADTAKSPIGCADL